jgi:hypothetical protein
MAHLVAIEPARHQQLYVLPEQVDVHAAGQNLIPVVPAELTHVATQLPVVLAKNGETGQFVLAALTGFTPNENLLLQQGRWQGLYLPLQIQRQPFFVGKATPDAEDYVVCIDIESPAMGQNQPLPAGAELLFLADGRETDFYRQAKQRLVHLLQGEQQRDALIEVLLRCQLLQPMSLDITFADQSTTRLNGLYTIDADKLAALAPELVVQLHQQGHLAAIYAILGSAAQIYGLIARKNQLLAG